jgi:predicted  nucleic acid-binding Zn-ribbon protein
MHKCAKCGRAASSLEEIDAGCPCGSKIFTFDRQAAVAVQATIAFEDGNAAPSAAGSFAPPPSDAIADGKAQPFPPLAMGNNGGNGHDGNNGKEASAAAESGTAPESYHARLTFTDEDVENIKVLTQGVFLLDVNAISKNPVVLKDEDDIYYVKLPLEQKRAKPPHAEGNGKK